MKKIIFFLLVACLALPSTISKQSLAAQRYSSAHEVFLETEAALENGNGDGTLTLETRGGPITFRIEMPDTNTVPILRTAYATADMFPKEGPEGTTVSLFSWHDAPDGWEVLMGTRDDVIGREVPEHTYRFRSSEEDVIAEGSPFNHAEAIAFFEQFLDTYAKPAGWDFRTDGIITANSRSYKAADYGQGFVPFLDQPITGPGHDTGFYELEFTQYLHGVPYFKDASSLNYSKKEYCIYPWGKANAWLLSPEHYDFWFCPIVETEMIEEDIPLAPFSVILKTLEDISAPKGDCLFFGYTLRYDPDAPTTSAITVPIWIFSTGHFNLDTFYINAQTGELFDPSQEAFSWRTWEDVGS